MRRPRVKGALGPRETPAAMVWATRAMTRPLASLSSSRMRSESLKRCVSCSIEMAVWFQVGTLSSGLGLYQQLAPM